MYIRYFQFYNLLKETQQSEKLKFNERITMSNKVILVLGLKCVWGISW